MKRLLAIVSLVLCLLAPATALAYNPLDAACQAGSANSSGACQSRGSASAQNGPVVVIRKVTTIIAVIAGVTAIMIMVRGGFQYITSAGDPQKASSARSTVLGSIIGLVIIVAAQSILLLVLSKL